MRLRDLANIQLLLLQRLNHTEHPESLVLLAASLPATENVPERRRLEASGGLENEAEHAANIIMGEARRVRIVHDGLDLLELGFVG